MSVRPLLSVAPMMDRTDRHFRALARSLSRRALLYSEMITAQAVVRGDTERLLRHAPNEGPVVLQLGGDDPVLLAAAAAAGETAGYDEINLNVGCPSPRVSAGNFGACLMADPERVGACLAAMASAVDVPVSVKHRIGIDDRDSYDDLLRFVDGVATVSGGVPAAYTVHARKAWLTGLSPKENRTVPPLRYDDVYRLKRERPALTIELNGGVRSIAQAAGHLPLVDGVMIGRAAYEDPSMLADVDPLLYGEAPPVADRGAVIHAMLPYVDDHLQAGGSLMSVARHLVNLFRGVPGGRAWRRVIAERAHEPGAGVDVLQAAAAAVPDEALHAPLGTPPACAARATEDVTSAGEALEVVPGDDEVLDLVGAFADAR